MNVTVYVPVAPVNIAFVVTVLFAADAAVCLKLSRSRALIGLGEGTATILPLIYMVLLESESEAKAIVAELPKTKPFGKFTGTVAEFDRTVDPVVRFDKVKKINVPVLLI